MAQQMGLLPRQRSTNSLDVSGEQGDVNWVQLGPALYLCLLPTERERGREGEREREGERRERGGGGGGWGGGERESDNGV